MIQSLRPALKVFGLLSFIPLLAWPARAQNPALTARGLVIRTWGTEAGLAQNTVTAIVQTRDGYLWTGTRDGIARFDGIRFQVKGLSDGLRSGDILSLLEDRGGTLWIGSTDGLATYENGRIEVVPAADQRRGGETIVALAEDAQGDVWVGTRSGLRFRRQGQLVEREDLAELSRTSIRFLLRDGESMWIATNDRGLLEYRQGRLLPCPGPAGIERFTAYCLLLDRRGWLWASIGNGTLLCRQNGQWRAYTQNDGLPFAYVTCLAEDREGTVWAGSLDDGLFSFDGSRFNRMAKEDGLSGNDIRSLRFDREGNLWVGTRTGGLNRLSRSSLRHCGVAQGLTNDFARGVTEAEDGTLYVATTGGGIYRGTLQALSPFRPGPEASFYAHVDTVLAARDGGIWWGGANALLHWREGEPLRAVTDEPWMLHGTAVTALKENSLGDLWIGSSEGRLIKLRGGKFTEFPLRVARGTVTALVTATNGDVWVGSVAGGLKRIREGSDDVLSVTNGLFSTAIHSLYLDRSGVLWIGTAGGGLARWESGRVFSFTADHGMPARTVSQIIEDNSGSLWLGTMRGILRVRRHDLNECAAGTVPFVHARSYGVNEGMPAEECSGGFCPSGLKTKSGFICFSTVKGLVYLDPQAQQVERTTPRVLLEEIMVNGRPRVPVVDPAGGSGKGAPRLVIQPGERNVELHYTAIQFSAPEKIGFRYQLAGVDPDWIEAADRRTVYYQRLPPGEFSFRVKGCNADGVWSEQETTLAIAVQPYFRETRSFRVLAVTGSLGFVAGAIWGVLRSRYKRRLAGLETLHAIERERLRISRDMHDQVGGMLTQVSQLSDLGSDDAGNRDAVKGRFARIGDRAREAVQALDEIVWAINPKNDNLASFAEYMSRFSDEFFENSNIRCWQEVPEALPKMPLRADIRHNVFLAAREALNNVLKHSRTSEVWIRLNLDTDRATLEIEDNGCGFDDANAAPGGNGVENMRTRLMENGGRTEFESRPGRGTKVRFVFPVR